MRNKRKALGVAVLLSVAFAMSAQAGWDQDGTGYYYLTDDNAYLRDQVMTIDGAIYGFNSSAYMMTGWSQVGGDWYYFDPSSGAAATGWLDLDGSWYYLDPSTGIMKTSILKLGANWYYLDENGVLKTNCYFDANDGLARCADANGILYRNTTIDDGNGNIFKFDGEGRIQIANSSTRALASANGGSSFSDDFMTMSDFDAFKENIQWQVSESVEEVKEERYDAYIKKKKSGMSSTQKSRWEYTTRNALAKVGLSDEEIDEFIREVEYGIYDGSDDYDYDDDDYDD